MVYCFIIYYVSYNGSKVFRLHLIQFFTLIQNIKIEQIHIKYQTCFLQHLQWLKRISKWITFFAGLIIYYHAAQLQSKKTLPSSLSLVLFTYNSNWICVAVFSAGVENHYFCHTSCNSTTLIMSSNKASLCAVWVVYFLLKKKLKFGIKNIIGILNQQYSKLICLVLIPYSHLF